MNISKTHKTFCSFFLIKKNQKIKAADNFRAHYFLFAHALQLVIQLAFARCPPQTVMLTSGHHSKQEITRLTRKFSEAMGNPSFFATR